MGGFVLCVCFFSCEVEEVYEDDSEDECSEYFDEVVVLEDDVVSCFEDVDDEEGDSELADVCFVVCF